VAAYLKLFRKGPLTFTKEFVKIPTNDNMALHRTFSIISFHSDYLKPIEIFENATIRKFIGFKDLFLRFLPALINVAKGDISFFLVQRMDAKRFRPADHIDLAYGQELRRAVKNGVEVIVCDVTITLEDISLNKELPCLL